MKNRIREIRKKRNLTIEELSEKSGISRVSINRYELGLRMPDLDVALSIANALKCTVDDLIEPNDDKKVV